jgi:phosphoserine phosphatase
MSLPLPEAHAERLARLLVGDQLVLFVGAGISRQALPQPGVKERMPLWRDLASRVASLCRERTDHYNENILDLFDAIEANQSRGALEDAVKQSIPENSYNPSPLHTVLSQMPWHIVYTTNYDNIFARALNESEAVDSEMKYEWFFRESGRRPRLIHLHGTLSNLVTLTGNDYSKWVEKNPIAYNYLQNIALNKSILFVGYSFSDPHLKFGLLPWIREVSKGRGRRHYAWMWGVTPEQAKLLDKRDFIETVPVNSEADWLSAAKQIEACVANLVAAKAAPPKKPRRSVSEKPRTNDEVVINGYKLFFFRTRRQMSLRRLSADSDVDAQKINNLEQVKVKMAAGPNCFKTATRDELLRLERALSCQGELEFGNQNDFLATYIMYYKVNHKKKSQPETTRMFDFSADTKAVVFDFGGTLTRSSSPTSTWERMWLEVGYKVDDAGHLHRQYVAGNISHQQWCDMTCKKLRDKGFSKDTMRKIISRIEPIPGLYETLSVLKNQGTSLHIVSGSVREIIQSVLGNSWEFLQEVKSNEFIYDGNGLLSEIRGHQFDFEGKAKFVSRVIDERRCSPLEVLFVGNSLNDSWASQSGARTLCVNPSHVDYSDTRIWTDYIRNMENLREILPFARRIPMT